MIKSTHFQNYVFLLVILALVSVFFSVTWASSSKEALSKTIEIIKNEGEDKLAELQAQESEVKEREATAKLLQENAKRKLTLLNMQEEEFKKKFNSLKHQKEEAQQEQAKAQSEEKEAKQALLNLQQMQHSVKKKSAMLENEVKAVLKKMEEQNKVPKNEKQHKETKKAENKSTVINAKKNVGSTQTAEEAALIDVAIPGNLTDVPPPPAPADVLPAAPAIKPVVFPIPK